jgi:hypothetical protein
VIITGVEFRAALGQCIDRVHMPSPSRKMQRSSAMLCSTVDVCIMVQQQPYARRRAHPSRSMERRPASLIRVVNIVDPSTQQDFNKRWLGPRTCRLQRSQGYVVFSIEVGAVDDERFEEVQGHISPQQQKMEWGVAGLVLCINIRLRSSACAAGPKD